MFRFADPQYLYLLSVVPVLVLLHVLVSLRERRRWQRLADAELQASLAPAASARRRHFKFALMALGVALLAVLLARPQMGTKDVTDEKTGIEVAFVIDVSNSMLAPDVHPNRIERAKLLVSTLIDRMPQNKVALGIFAGEAYPQLPITNDFTSAKLFLEQITPGMVTLQGTNVAAAINLASASFTAGTEVGRAIVIITDGEDHEPGAIEAAEQAAADGMNLYLLGIGSAAGAKIPQSGGGFLLDEEGGEVVTALNEEACRQLAKAGKGAYFHVTGSNDAQEELLSQLSTLRRGVGSLHYTEADEQFRAIALLALLVLVIESLVMEAKNRALRHFKLLGKR